MTPLEQQAREAGEEIANSLFTHRSVFWDRCATDCAKAYLAAAEPRERLLKASQLIIDDLHAEEKKNEAEIEALRAEVNDWRESARKAAEESCGDEVHCTCVGPLRARVAELETQVSLWVQNALRGG